MQKEFEWNGNAMGTEYSIVIICDESKIAETIYKEIEKDIQEYEKTFSRFIPTSELSIINENKKMIVSSAFLEVTKKAYDLFVKTKGIFNPLVQISRLGYNKRFVDLENKPKVDNDTLYDIDFSTVIIDEETSYIELQEGQKLDYGGFLKGFLAEKLAKKIKNYSEGITGVIVNLGGDIYTLGRNENQNKFTFNIYNPVLPNQVIHIELENQSLATSGTYKRIWKNGGEIVHHILNQNGDKNPDTDIVSVSVIHPCGARAEAYTKMFFGVDPVHVQEILGEKISFILIKNNGEVMRNI